MKKTKGRFTIPAQAGMDKEVKLLADKWGADAIRDSDGTVLSPEITSMGYDVYSTLCLIRADQEWNKAHMDHCQQKFLMSPPATAVSDVLKIDILKGFSKEQFQPDTVHDIKKYWEVLNRTSGELIDSLDWDFDEVTGLVTVKNTQKGCVYTVNVLVYQIWETTSMYNHITNGWTGEHQSGVDPRQPETYEHLLKYLDYWLETHPNTDWVRFTSVAYQFPIMKDENYNSVYQDWAGILDPMSALALDEFEKEYGYRLRGEHMVDEGYYNSLQRVPSQEYTDWTEFVNKFVNKFAKACVEKVHAAGKKAIMFFCDHWIGTEPYWPNFKDIGFDGVVGPCINGRELRRLGDVPGNMVKELRLYPYFFPVDLMDEPMFSGDGNPIEACKEFWMDIRRALLRMPIDRIGFGGYLDLVMKYPDFIDYVGQMSNEYREFCNKSNQTKFQGPSFKVGILNCWGKSRSWMWDQTWPKGGIIESLSGLAVELEFFSFEDIRNYGIPKDMGVILNIGEGETAWTGGKHWADPEIASAVRAFVANGGGFVGVMEPTSYQNQGRYFQLSDVLGVQRERGQSRDNKKIIEAKVLENHFITEDYIKEVYLGKLNDEIYIAEESTKVLKQTDSTILMSINEFDKGRAFYLNEFEFTPENNRMLLRAIFWTSGKEDEMFNWYGTNVNTEVAAFPETGNVIIINSSNEKQKTRLHKDINTFIEIELAPNESRWYSMNSL